MYDESGRAVTAVKTINGVTGSFTIERDYDAFGPMVSLTYPDSAHEVVQYGCDQAGNLSSAGIYAAFSDYNALGQPGKVDYGNGVDTLLQYYDGTIPGAVSYRLESIKTVKSGSNRRWIEYAYDNNGNLTSRITGARPSPCSSTTKTGSPAILGDQGAVLNSRMRSRDVLLIVFAKANAYAYNSFDNIGWPPGVAPAR